MHTFQRDDVVTVFNQTMSGKVIIEGKARIVQPVEGVDEQYEVRFGDEEPKVERFVDPAGQIDPEAHLDELNAPRA